MFENGKKIIGILIIIGGILIMIWTLFGIYNNVLRVYWEGPFFTIIFFLLGLQLISDNDNFKLMALFFLCIWMIFAPIVISFESTLEIWKILLFLVIGITSIIIGIFEIKVVS